MILYKEPRALSVRRVDRVMASSLSKPIKVCSIYSTARLTIFWRNEPAQTGIISYVIELDIPGRGAMRLQYLVTDVNGTLAVDGRLIDGIVQQIGLLKERFTIHLLTADTHGRQATIDAQLHLTAVRISPGNDAAQKADYVRRLGAEAVVALGQGANDAAMLKEAALGICVMSQEGLATEAFLCADLLTPDIATALELLNHPLRIVASLRK